MSNINLYTGARCFTGPSTDLEKLILQPLIILGRHESLRAILLSKLTSSNSPTIQVRELLMRIIKSELAPMFSKIIYVDKDTNICQKRGAIDIDADLSRYYLEYKEGLKVLNKHGIPDAQIELLQKALDDGNACLRITTYCCIVLLLVIVERRLSS